MPTSAFCAASSSTSCAFAAASAFCAFLIFSSSGLYFACLAASAAHSPLVFASQSTLNTYGSARIAAATRTSQKFENLFWASQGFATGTATPCRRFARAARAVLAASRSHSSASSSTTLAYPASVRVAPIDEGLSPEPCSVSAST